MSTPKRRRDEDVSDAPLTLREAETSLRGAAALREALEQHSYAVVALDAADALAVRQCAEAGLAYFKTPEATKRTHRHVFSDAGGAGLCGWNKPHAAKEVLRLRRGGPPAPVAAAPVAASSSCDSRSPNIRVDHSIPPRLTRLHSSVSSLCIEPLTTNVRPTA